MNCSEVEILMVQEVQGELSPSEAARLQRHVAECPKCRRALHELRQVWGMLDAWTVPEPPADLARSFALRLAEAAAQSRKRASFLHKLERPSLRGIRLRLTWNLAGLALAACLLVGVFHLLGYQPGGPGTTAPGTLLTAQRTPLTLQPALVSTGTPERAIRESRPERTFAPGETLPHDRLIPEGIAVERPLERPALDGQIHFAVHNFSTNVPEISTKHYNTVSTLYENPL